MVLLYNENKRRISVCCKLLPGYLNAKAKTLNISQDSHGLSKMRISIVCYAGLPEVLTSDLTERPTRAMDLDTIREPVDAHGRIGSFVPNLPDRVDALTDRSQL
jgi:hypothetical protein